MRRAGGFTLVEVLVALGVFAVISISVYGRTGDVIAQLGELESRTLASWVAQNRLAELTLEYREAETPIPIGRSEGLVRLGGREWRVATELEPTSDDALRRVEIRVRGGAVPVSEADPVFAERIGFLAVH